MRYLIAIITLTFFACAPDIDCTRFDNSALNIKNVNFFYASDSDIAFLEEQSTKGLLDPVECGDKLWVKKPYLQRIETGSKLYALWDCIPTIKSGDINDIKFLERANKRGLLSIPWDSLQNGYNSTLDSAAAGAHFLKNTHKDAIVFSLNKAIDGGVSNIDSLRNNLNTLTCGNTDPIFVIIINTEGGDLNSNQINSYEIAFSDDVLTDIAKVADVNERNEKLSRVKNDLIGELQKEPTDWTILYLLARAELLLNPNSEKSRNQAADYLIKASHEALSKQEHRNLLSLINKYEHEAFKDLLSQENERRWNIESCKVGLKKGKKEYLSTSINWMALDSKGKWKVNIDPDQLYNHIGYFKNFSIGVKDYNPSSSACVLNFTYPWRDNDFERVVSLAKFESKTLSVGNGVVVTLTNQSKKGNDFATIVYAEKKNENSPVNTAVAQVSKKGGTPVFATQKEEVVTLKPAPKAISKPTTFKPGEDSDGDGIVNKNDECPTRFGNKNGCPEIAISHKQDVFLGESVSFQMKYPGRIQGDRVVWESLSSVDIIGSEGETPKLVFPSVGKYPVSVAVNNYSDDFYTSQELDVYVKIKKEELESIFMDIVRYGNDGKWVKGTEEQRRFFKDKIAADAAKAEKQLTSIVENMAIPIQFRATSKLSVMLNKFKAPKSVNTTINDFRIRRIEYSKTSGLINKIECDFN